MLACGFTNNTKTTNELDLNSVKNNFLRRIEFAVDDIVLAHAEANWQGNMYLTGRPIVSAANCASQSNAGLDRGLIWIEKAIAQNKSFPKLMIDDK